MLILGHRGAILNGAPFHQNSQSAFQEALSVSDGFESDACADSQGEIFLIHEAKYINSHNGVEYCAAEHLDTESVAVLGNRRIDQLTTNEAKRLRLKDGSPLPLLRDALALTGQAHHRLIDIELKGYEVVASVLRLVDEAIQQKKITQDSVLLSSFNHPALLTVRQHNPDMQVGAIFVGDDVPAAPLFPWIPNSAGYYIPLTAVAMKDDTLKKIEPDYFIMPEEILTKETMDMVDADYPAAKLMAWVFTEKNNFDLPDLLARLKELHPTGKIAAMMVDNPREFRDVWRQATNT